MIEYHDPRGKVGQEMEPYDLSIQLEGSNSARVGLLANGFPDSENFLHELAAVLKEKQPGLEMSHYVKSNLGAAVSGEALESISKTCQAVIAAYGH